MNFSPVPVRIQDFELPVIEFQAKKLAEFCKPGNSIVRKDTDERMKAAAQDCLVSQLGEYAFHKYLYGIPFPRAYMLNRWHLLGATTDGGQDVAGANVDVKARLMAYGDDLAAYYMPIRERERREGWVYVLAVVEPPKPVGVTVHLVGWATEKMLPATTGHPALNHPRFADAYVLEGRELWPFPPIAFNWFRKESGPTCPSRAAAIGKLP